MRRAVIAIALLAFGAGCQTAVPVSRLPEGDPRPDALLAAWRAHTESRTAVAAFARFAVDAPGAGVGGSDLTLRSKQRLWLARPAQLRVEVLGFLDTTLAVLVTDGERYALLQTQEHRFEQGPVYDGFLWDAARIDLSPDEAVDVILGAAPADLVRGAAYDVGDGVRIELVGAAGRVQRVVEFGSDGDLRRVDQIDAEGRTTWEATYDDYVEIAGSRFAQSVALRSGSGRARADLALRDVELNPDVPPDIFQLRAPAGFDVEPELLPGDPGDRERGEPGRASRVE